MFIWEIPDSPVSKESGWHGTMFFAVAWAALSACRNLSSLKLPLANPLKGFQRILKANREWNGMRARPFFRPARSRVPETGLDLPGWNRQ